MVLWLLDFGPCGWVGVNGCVVLVPFLSGVRRDVDDSCFPEINRSERFDPVASLAGYHQSFKIDWVSIEPSQRLYHCQFSAGHLFDDSEKCLV